LIRVITEVKEQLLLNSISMAAEHDDIYTFIRASEVPRIDQSKSNGSKEVIAYTIVLEKQGINYQVIFNTRYHNCASGYCGATTSTVSPIRLEDKKSDHRFKAHLTPINREVLQVRLRNVTKVHIILETVEGVPLFTCWMMGEHSDGWYPTGEVRVNNKILARRVVEQAQTKDNPKAKKMVDVDGWTTILKPRKN
jgi:hypothetical protein